MRAAVAEENTHGARTIAAVCLGEHPRRVIKKISANTSSLLAKSILRKHRRGNSGVEHCTNAACTPTINHANLCAAFIAES